MATETLPAADDREIERQPRDAICIVGGGGQNAEHMADVIARLNADRGVYIFEVTPPREYIIDPSRYLLTNTPEGRREADRLIDAGVLRTVLLSVVPGMHVKMLKEWLGYAAQGKVDAIVIPKPFVSSREELAEIRTAYNEAVAQRQAIDPEYSPERQPLISIHEHYDQKGALVALLAQYEAVTQRLGRLESATVDIQEPQTAEDEGRVAAFGGGALEDLGPHVISLGLAIQDATNVTARYTIADRSSTSVERFRYAGAELPDGVETGFIVRGATTITDRERAETHDLKFTWRGGKGLTGNKAMHLTFVQPDTGERSMITVDFQTNTLDVPESVRPLFPKTQFEDNGYGRSVEIGLRDDPRVFQSMGAAAMVITWLDTLRRQGTQIAATQHQRGFNLSQIPA